VLPTCFRGPGHTWALPVGRDWSVVVEVGVTLQSSPSTNQVDRHLVTVGPHLEGTAGIPGLHDQRHGTAGGVGVLVSGIPVGIRPKRYRLLPF